MKEYNELVTKTKEIEELEKKIKAKIKEDSRVIEVDIFGTIIRISTKYHTIALYEPTDINNIVVMIKNKDKSEILLNTESPEEYDNLECKIKEDGKWLKEYVKKLFNIKQNKKPNKKPNLL